MSATSSPTSLPTAMARAAVVSPVGPRHAAPESDDAVVPAGTGYGAASPDRHGEPDWERWLFDPACDDDPFDWLGFTAEQG